MCTAVMWNARYKSNLWDVMVNGSATNLLRLNFTCPAGYHVSSLHLCQVLGLSVYKQRTTTVTQLAKY